MDKKVSRKVKKPDVVTLDNVDQYIDELKEIKGKYITQGVSFNRDNPREMHLLKMVLLEQYAFSALIKEMLAVRYNIYGATFLNTEISVTKDDNFVQRNIVEERVNVPPVNSAPAQAAPVKSAPDSKTKLSLNGFKKF